MKGRLYYPPVQRPRPLSDITEVDPEKERFEDTMKYALWMGFSDYTSEEYYGTPMTSHEGTHTRFFFMSIETEIRKYNGVQTQNILDQ